jgi:pimeloyl-ACP methyl ester carboxylesterase
MSIPFQLEVSQDRIIRADWFPSVQPSQGTLIICHGYKGFKDWGMFPYMGEQLSERLDVITFNFSHNGVGDDLTNFTELEKFAKNTYSRELEDIDFLVQAIHNGELPLQQQIPAKPLFLLGHSRGAGIALIYSFDHPHDISGVISWNGITNLAGLFSEKEKQQMKDEGRAYIFNGRTRQQMPLDVEILEDLDINAKRFNVIDRVKLSKVPIALIQGSDDFQNLRKGSAQLVEANPSIAWIQVPDGTHTFGTVHPFQGKTKPLDTAINCTQQFIEQSLTKSF